MLINCSVERSFETILCRIMSSLTQTFPKHLICLYVYIGLHRRRVLMPAYLHENLIWSRNPQWINPLTRRDTSNSFLPQRPIRPTATSSKPSQYPPKPDDDAICSSYDRCDHALLLSSRLGEKEHTDTSTNGRQQKRHLIDKMRSLGFTSRYLSVFPPEERLPTSYHFFDFPVRQKGKISQQ